MLMLRISVELNQIQPKENTLISNRNFWKSASLPAFLMWQTGTTATHHSSQKIAYPPPIRHTKFSPFYLLPPTLGTHRLSPGLPQGPPENPICSPLTEMMLWSHHPIASHRPIVASALEQVFSSSATATGTCVGMSSRDLGSPSTLGAIGQKQRCPRCASFKQPCLFTRVPRQMLFLNVLFYIKHFGKYCPKT